MLRPADIEAKTFHTSLRGYDLDEVDDFLDEVVATIRELTERLEAAESDSGKITASDESAVGRALVTAQATADQIVADATEKAAKMLEAAKEEADEWTAAREEKKQAAAAEMAELAEHVGRVRTQLAVLATAVADRLDEMDDALVSGVSDVHDEAHEGQLQEEKADVAIHEEVGEVPEDRSEDDPTYDIEEDVEEDDGRF